MPHFIIKKENILDDIIKIEDYELYNHLIKVMRVCAGEKIKFTDEYKNFYFAELLKSDKKSAEFRIIKKSKNERIPNFNITVGKCILKQDADFSALQKATELGARAIIPIFSDNCAVKRSFIENKIDKMQKIVKGSVEQCERADIPNVLNIKTIDEVLEMKKEYKIIVFSERADSKYVIKEYCKNNMISKNDKLLLIFGPEGGFSKREFELFEKNEIPEISLGNLILRADTALTAGVYGVIQEL